MGGLGGAAGRASGRSGQHVLVTSSKSRPVRVAAASVPDAGV